MKFGEQAILMSGKGQKREGVDSIFSEEEKKRIEETELMSLYVTVIFMISPSGYKNNFDGENINEKKIQESIRAKKWWE